MPPISIDGVLGETVLFELLWGCFLFLWLLLSFYLFWLGFLCDVFGLTWQRGFDCEAGKGAGFDFIFEEEWLRGLADKIIDDSCLSLDLGLFGVEHSWLWFFEILRTHILVDLFEGFKDVLALLDDFDLSDNHLFLFCKIIINKGGQGPKSFSVVLRTKKRRIKRQIIIPFCLPCSWAIQQSWWQHRNTF